MEGTELATVGSRQVGVMETPEETLDRAMLAAKALGRVIALKTKPVIMNGEQYLEFEDWATVAQFYATTVATFDAMPCEVDGVKGAKAKAQLVFIKTGEPAGPTAEAYCLRDEPKWNTRTKYEWQEGPNGREKVAIGEEVVPWFQLASMAQTRAGAKAFRNRFSWVVVLAGYRPTPAEEMTGNEGSRESTERKPQEGDAHYCAEHKVLFFKKGKMRGYAHKLDTGEWHNEPEPPKAAEGEFREVEPTPDKAFAALGSQGTPNPPPEPVRQTAATPQGAKVPTLEQHSRIQELLDHNAARQRKEDAWCGWKWGHGIKELIEEEAVELIAKLEAEAKAGKIPAKQEK